jgi:nucleoside diphosphate kinase
MKMFSTLFLLVSIFTFSNTAFACADSVLENKGFEIHNSEMFEEKTKEIINWYENNMDTFSTDLNGKVWSTELNGFVHIKTFDNSMTPQSEMFGDIMFVTELFSGELVEMRWYKNSKKNIIYNSSIQSCATNVVPYAVNALL